MRAALKWRDLNPLPKVAVKKPVKEKKARVKLATKAQVASLCEFYNKRRK